MKQFLLMTMLLVIVIGCRSYIQDRPLSPGMTTEEVRQAWGDNARKEWIMKDGVQLDFWYYNFGMSQRLYTVLFSNGKCVGFYSKYIGPQHVVVHHSGSVNVNVQ